jgi:hypothetical protein
MTTVFSGPTEHTTNALLGLLVVWARENEARGELEQNCEFHDLTVAGVDVAVGAGQAIL